MLPHQPLLLVEDSVEDRTATMRHIQEGRIGESNFRLLERG